MLFTCREEGVPLPHKVKRARWLICVLLLWWMSWAWLMPAEAASEQQPATTQTMPPQSGSYSVLADVLEDEAARNRLIEELRALATGHAGSMGAASSDGATADDTGTAQPAGGTEVEAATAASGAEARETEVAEPSNSDADATSDSLSARIADLTQRFVQTVGDDVKTALTLIGVEEFEEQQDAHAAYEGWRAALLALVLVIVATLLAYAVLRFLARKAYRVLDERVARVTELYLGETEEDDEQGARRRRPDPATIDVLLARGDVKARLIVSYRKTLAIVGALIIDIGVVLLAAVVGHASSIVVTAVLGASSTFETVFINAFIGVEIGKALVRGVFATRFPFLRLFSMSDELAVYWNRWASIVISVAGYGILVAVPLIHNVLSPATGHVVGLVIMLGVYVYAVGVILRNRLTVRERLRERADQIGSTFFGSLLRMLARSWHVIAIVYFTVLLVATQINQEEALPFMAEATFQTLIAIGAAMLVSMLLSLLLHYRIRLSLDWRMRLPLLEARLNSYIPALVHGLRLAVFIFATLVVLDAWHVFSLADWMESEFGRRVVTTLVHIGIILVLAAVIWVVVASLIEHRLNTMPGSDSFSARRKTLLSLFRNAAMIIIATLTVLVVLSQIGIDIAPLIAGAGVVGLAIGFGAQKLVQDIITGVFIQLENGMNQNDVVEVAGIFGTVEKLTLRSVGIRTLDGGFHLIPFSTIDKVSNHMRDFSYHLGHYTLSYRENVDEAIYHLKQAFEELKEDAELAPSILEDISIPGVTALDEKGFTIRVMIKTAPGMQWAVQRAYNRLVKKHFNAAGIELPYPHTVVYFGQDKNGYAPPLRVRAAVADATQSDDTPDTELYPDGRAPAPGYTRRNIEQPAQAAEEGEATECSSTSNTHGGDKVTARGTAAANKRSS